MAKQKGMSLTAKAAARDALRRSGNTDDEATGGGVIKAPKIEVSDTPVSLAAILSSRSVFQKFGMWLVGDTPLICHSWSHKAKNEMLLKQIGAVRASGKEKRNPEEDFVNSLYEMEPGSGRYGFPVTGVKNCILSSAHKDKGIARTTVLSALFLNADMVRSRPALAGAICDMPLVEIYGGQPEMREDMVRIGAGLNKVANLAYRGQFTVWAMKIEGQFNPAVLSGEALAFLVQESGLAQGLGEWRNEKKGLFGSFHLASVDEEKQWEAYKASGRDAKKLPLPANFRMAAE